MGRPLTQHVLGNLQLQDLRRAFVDAVDAGIAEEALGVIFGEIAGAAVNLHDAVNDAIMAALAFVKLKALLDAD